MTNGEKFKEVFKISQVDEGELYVYVWLPTHDAVEISNDWWNAEYEEPTTKNDDLALIHTWGLDEGIRCAMCANSMKSDRGCDGGCVVNNAMYKEIMDVIENHIVDTDKMVEPTTKNDLGVDKFDKAINQSDLEEWIMGTFPDWCVGDVRLIMNHMDEMPSVTPQESVTIPYLIHKELDIPISECQKAYDVAIEYLRSQAKLKG